MSASLHLARYRPRQVAGMLTAMRRDWPALAGSSGLAAARLFVLAEMGPALGGLVAPTRWALLCAWQDGAARDRFLADGGALRPFLLGARESFHASLETVRCSKPDRWWGWQPDVAGVTRFGAEEPVLALTYARISTRNLGRFAWHNQRINRDAMALPGLQFRIAALDTVNARATLTYWRSERELTDFAYRQQHHPSIRTRARAEPWGDRFFFARFRPLATSGSWDGVEPLAVTSPSA